MTVPPRRDPHSTEFEVQRARSTPPPTPDLEAIGSWIQTHLAATWLQCWEDNQSRLNKSYAQIGEGAYGVYNTVLFRPIHAELKAAGLHCRPRLPGSLAHSFEPETPADDRIRHMWSFVWDTARGPALGAVVTSFPHDHTRLRLPRAPSVSVIAETSDRAVLRSFLATQATATQEGEQT